MPPDAVAEALPARAAMVEEQGTRAPAEGMSGEATRTRLVRYHTVDGIRTVRDSTLAALFVKARDEGVLRTVMYSDDVARWTSQTFIDFFRNESRACWLVLRDGKLGGWVWLDDFGHRTARIHFCFFRWLGRERLTVQVGRDLLWQLLHLEFRNGTRLAAIRGETPAFNKLALRFIQKVGLRVVGEIPSAAYRQEDGELYPMVYSFINLEVLKERIAADPLATAP
jgi:hypothetical protein